MGCYLDCQRFKHFVRVCVLADARYPQDRPSPVPFRTIISKINEDDEEEAAESENFQENVPHKKVNEANEMRRPLSEHNKNLEH